MSPKATNTLILDLEFHAVRESSPVPLSSLTGSGRVDKLSETTGEGYMENPSRKVAATSPTQKGVVLEHARLHAHTTGYQSELNSQDASPTTGKEPATHNSAPEEAWGPRNTAPLFQPGMAGSNPESQASQNVSIPAQAPFSEWVEVCLV